MAVKQVSLDITRADYVQKVLELQGKRYSLDRYPMFRGIFNTPEDRVVMRAGRQVSKTVTLAASMTADTTISPYYPVIYCNSSSSQTNSFSTSKLDPFLIQSPWIYKTFMKGEHVIDNVYNKRLSNFSEIIMSYFSENGDRVRGRSGNKMYLDEVQDMLYDAVIDAEECLSAAAEPKYMYAGTSKSLNTTLEFMWGLSTQKEWVIKCDHCGKWNRPSVQNIGKHGLICKSCGGGLHTYSGQWHAFNPTEQGGRVFADGFWIPQIILPMHCCNEDKWQKLLEKFEKYPEYKFLNEVMGIPIGEGDSPITKDMLIKACIPELPCLPYKCEQNSAGAMHICAGIDWGGGGVSGTSRTTLSVFAVYPDRQEFVKIFGKIYSGGEPTKHLDDIANRLRSLGVIYAFGDHGGGNFSLSQLARMVPEIRVVPVMYTDQAVPFKWDDKANRYTVSRTIMIDNFFIDYKAGKIRTFNWGEFETMAEDILCVRQEWIGVEGKERRVWRRPPAKPDDILHSMVFGWFAARVMSSMLNFTVAH